MKLPHAFIRSLALIFSVATGLQAAAHPGIGIVADSRGNIYYTDLQHVYRISGGNRSVFIPSVHTNELYIDSADNLYGESERYDPSTESFYHYMWRKSASGKLDTVFHEQQAYIKDDYSLAMDREGNQYFLMMRDSTALYLRDSEGKISLVARWNFGKLSWLHPQKKGEVLFIKDNSVYRISQGEVKLVAKDIATHSSFAFSNGHHTLYGIWTDNKNNIYVAVFSEQAVKKIAPDGNISTVYTSKGNYAPTHGVFDNQGQLWVLESSDKNEVRVVKAGAFEISGVNTISPGALVMLAVMAGGVIGLIWFSRHKKFLNR